MRPKADDHVHRERGSAGDGLEVTVTLSNGQTITIPVGSSSGSVNVAVGDDVYAGTAVMCGDDRQRRRAAITKAWRCRRCRR